MRSIRMIILLLVLLNVGVPVEGQMGGVYCDEVVGEILRYQEDTGAFSEEQLRDLMDGCDRWEEREAEEDSK